jgi:hypothetical protein
MEIKCPQCGLPFQSSKTLCRRCRIMEETGEYKTEGTYEDLQEMLKILIDMDVCHPKYDQLNKDTFLLKRWLERDI